MTRLIGVDGRSGAGKSTLAARIASRFAASEPVGTEVTVVGLDLLCPGWHGLDRAVDLAVRWILQPAAARLPAAYRRWDWARDCYAERVDVPAGVVIVEGCGIGSARARRHLDMLVWVDAPEGERRRRVTVREREFLARGGAAPPGEAGREPLWWWPIWAAQEDAVLARERTREHADRVVDSAGEPRCSGATAPARRR